jgi:predicted aspartyl protease
MVQAKCGFDDFPGGASGRDVLLAYGPTLKVSIGFDPGYKPEPASSKPFPGLEGIDALIDTGASESCIDTGLATQLNLPVVERREIAGVHGVQLANFHLAQVYVPELDVTIYGAFASVDLATGGLPHKALIGRTFLQSFTMVYEGPTGAVTISSD